jgi:hypothetical protein
VAKPAAPKIGRLLVTSNIEGAKITIDGRSEMAWATPYTIPDLPVGTHSVAVTKPGYSNYQQSITIEGGRTATLNAPLSVPAGEINISTVPPGIDVLIDGYPVGRSPVQKSVGIGQHTYTLQVPGRDPYTKTFEIKTDGSILTKNVDMSSLIAAGPTGIVEVRTIPPGATVQVEGKTYAGTPTSFRLSAGRHTLTISLSGYAPLQKEVDVPADGSLAVNEKLARQ